MNASEAATAKARLRAEVREKIRGVHQEKRDEAAGKVGETLQRIVSWSAARWVGGYVALRDELDLSGPLRQRLALGGRVAVPAWDAERGEYVFREIRDWDGDLVPGAFGVREPRPTCGVVDVTWLDFVLVPGIAFDTRGGRLGRGRGFYDRLLAPAVGVTCGVGMDEQLVPEVPVEAHDTRLNLVVVPGGLFGPRAMEQRC
jgi:5-formyltetrahydrofolate cyclo-ligase